MHWVAQQLLPLFYCCPNVAVTYGTKQNCCPRVEAAQNTFLSIAASAYHSNSTLEQLLLYHNIDAKSNSANLNYYQGLESSNQSPIYQLGSLYYHSNLIFVCTQFCEGCLININNTNEVPLFHATGFSPSKCNPLRYLLSEEFC